MSKSNRIKKYACRPRNTASRYVDDTTGIAPRTYEADSLLGGETSIKCPDVERESNQFIVHPYDVSHDGKQK